MQLLTWVSGPSAELIAKQITHIVLKYSIIRSKVSGSFRVLRLNLPHRFLVLWGSGGGLYSGGYIVRTKKHKRAFRLSLGFVLAYDSLTVAKNQGRLSTAPFHHHTCQRLGEIVIFFKQEA